MNLLNKTLYPISQKIIYETFFLKQEQILEQEKHFKMWFNILHYDPNEIPYEKLLQDLLD